MNAMLSTAAPEALAKKGSIESITYITPENDQVRVTHDDGTPDWIVPYPPKSWHRGPIQAWLAVPGNEIAPYEAPTEEPEYDLAAHVADLEARVTALEEKPGGGPKTARANVPEGVEPGPPER